MAQLVKNLPAIWETWVGKIPGLGRSPGERKGYPFQYSGLENSMYYTVHGVTKSQTRLNNFHFHFSLSFSRLVIVFLPRGKHLLISWLQSPSTVILEPKKIKSVTDSFVSPSLCHELMGPDGSCIFIFFMTYLEVYTFLFTFPLSYLVFAF